MKKTVGLREKGYSYLIDDGSEDQKAKVTTSCIIIRKLKLEDYKNYLKATRVKNKIKHLEETEIDVDSHEDIKNS